MGAENFAQKIPAKSIHNILRRLNIYTSAKGTEEGFARPQLSLIVGGVKVSGEFCKFESDDGQEMLMLNLVPDDMLAFIPVAEIQALFIERPKDIAHIISFGGIARPVGEAEIKGLALAKEFKSITEGLNSFAGTNLSIDFADSGNSIINANALDYVKEVFSALKEIAEDDTGKQALKDVSVISIIPSAHNDIAKKDNNTIILNANLSGFLEFGLKNGILEKLNSIL